MTQRFKGRERQTRKPKTNEEVRTSIQQNHNKFDKKTNKRNTNFIRKKGKDKQKNSATSNLLNIIIIWHQHRCNICDGQSVIRQQAIDIFIEKWDRI